MQKHIQHNKDEQTQFFRNIYTSHFIWKDPKGLLKVLLCERWVANWTELQNIDPHSYGHNSVFFPFSWAAQLEAWGPSHSGTWSLFQLLLSNWSELQLIWTSCRRGYIKIWRPPTSWERHNLHSIQPLDSQGRPWSPDILDWMHPLFTQGHFFFW